MYVYYYTAWSCISHKLTRAPMMYRWNVMTQIKHHATSMFIYPQLWQEQDNIYSIFHTVMLQPDKKKKIPCFRLNALYLLWIDLISFMRSGSNRTKRRLAEMSCTWLSGYTGNSCMSCNRLSYWNRCSGYFDWFRLDVTVCCCWYNHNSNTLIVLMKHILVPFCDTMHLQINF